MPDASAAGPQRPQWPKKLAMAARIRAAELGYKADDDQVWLASTFRGGLQQIKSLEKNAHSANNGAPKGAPASSSAPSSPPPMQTPPTPVAPSRSLPPPTPDPRPIWPAPAALRSALKSTPAPDPVTGISGDPFWAAQARALAEREARPNEILDAIARDRAKAAQAGEILPPTAQQRLVSPDMASSLVAPGAPQSQIEDAIKRVLLAGFQPIDERRALDAISKASGAPKREFNHAAKLLSRELRDSVAVRAPKPWLPKLYVKGDETDPHPTMANACIVLRDAPQWAGVLWYNEFTGMLHVRVCPPWEGSRAGQPCDRPWTDADEAAATEWMQRYGGIPTIDGWRIFSAVSRVAAENPFHPLRDYFARLRSDFDPEELAREVHFDDWLPHYCGVADNPYTRGIGSRFLVSAVARIIIPGCKADCALILEGKQGIKKSSALRVLASDPYFTDATAEIGSKDAAMLRRGKWFWEYAELDNLARADVARAKADMSRTTDHFRPPYGRNTIEQPRQNVHCGTVNESSYLHDPTGGRRWWPARCAAVINLDALARDRDKLWAAAIRRFDSGAAWYLDDPELVAMAELAQKARYVEDVWQTPIAEWLNRQTAHHFTTPEIFEGALGIADKSKWSKADSNRIGAILRHLGWRSKPVRFGSGRDAPVMKRWVKSDDGEL